MHGDEIAAVAGLLISREDERVGVPWLLATDAAEKVPMSFTRRAKDVLNEMHAVRDKLANYVDVENEVSIRWLKWLGFQFLPAIPYGPFGFLFYPFVRINHV